MAEAHDDAVVSFGGDGQLARQGFFFDDEGMVAGGGGGIGKVAENIFVVVVNLARFAMKEFRGADDFSAKRGANSLVPEADTENGKFPSEALDQLHGNARLLRRARTGRDDDTLGLATGNLFDRNFVVAMDFDLATQLAEVLREVVGKRIVVVEKQNHNGFLDRFPRCAFSNAASSAFDLFTLS